MGKYIVELKKNETLYKATTRESDGTAYVCSAIGTPYTASDLEQVRKEAYEDGYKTAKVQCNIQTEKDLREVGERHYQKGLSDAWEAARKIRDMTWKEQIEAFGTDSYADIIALSASECIEKIRQYEQEKEEIQVGDEVNAPFGKAIVVNIDSVAKKIWLVYADGHGGFEYFKDAPTKTGRHFPEIAEVFAKMKESDNG